MKLIKSLLIAAIILLSIPINAQTNAFTSWSDLDLKDANGKMVGKHIKATFTMDSLGTVLLSKTIDLSGFLDVDMYTYPATFRFKTVSTYDSSNTQIRLLATYRSPTDTVFAIDTLRAYGLSGVTATQVETDSVGTLTFNGIVAPAVRIAVECLRSDVNTGYLDIVFRKEGKK
jgi:hypothetical protein